MDNFAKPIREIAQMPKNTAGEENTLKQRLEKLEKDHQALKADFEKTKGKG